MQRSGPNPRHVVDSAMSTGVSILYGPFPVRLGRFFGAFAALAVAIPMCAVAFERQRLHCDFGASGTCSIESFVSLRSDVRFATGELRDVAVESVRRGKGKGTEYGVVVLTVSNRQHRLMDAEPAEARAIAANIASARVDRKAYEVTLKGTPWLGLLAVVFAAMGLSMAWIALRRMGALRLTFQHDGSLSVERRVFGVPIRTHSLSLHGVTDVQLEWRDESDFWKGRYELPRQVARIALVTRDRSLPVTDEFWPGRTLHYRAAAELRRCLGFSPGALASELHVLENTLERPAIARTPAGRFGVGWAGACVGSLLGLALLGVVGLSLGFLRMQDGIEPWMLIVGSGGGAVSGVALALHLVRPRPPR